MKLSVFTTITNPEARGDNWRDALACYEAMADEVVVINGGETSLEGYRPFGERKEIKSYWPIEFDWPLIGQQFQKGYELATGDWVIHADLDFIFHEKDFATLREVLMANNEAPAMTLWKYQFILPDRYNLKSRLVVAVNKAKYGNQIRFNTGGDLCQPSLNGQELLPDFLPEARVPFYNYEKMTKTKDQIVADAGRMARAWARHFGQKKLGFEDMDAFREWFMMVRGRFNKPQEHIKLEDHPIFVQETIKNLSPDQWGYSGFDQLGENDYMKGGSNA